MRTVAVLGGSAVGSVTALLLARTGWQVTLVDDEFDLFSTPSPQLRARPGAPHTVQAHGFMARTLHELTTRLPDVRQALLDAGAPLITFASMVPPHWVDGGRPGDEQLDCLRVRRLTLDRVLGEAVAGQSGIRRVDSRATGLLLDESGPVPTATGLGLEDGSSVTAGLVIDAGGRRSPISRWLADAGIVQPQRVDPCEVIYYTRHHRVVGDAPRLNAGFAQIHQFPSFISLLFLGDNDTGMLAMSTHGKDPLLKRLRHDAAFSAVMAAMPGFEEWAVALDPIGSVFCLGALDNRMRFLVRDGRPVVRGLHQVGDALCMTNPTRGRGLSMGLAAAGALCDLLGDESLDPDDLALAYDAWQQRVLAIYYRETAASDVTLDRQLRAGLAGQAIPRNAPGIELPEGHPVTSEDLDRAADADPDLLRATFRATMLLDDERVIASERVAARTRAVLDALPPSPGRPSPPTDGLHDRSVLEAVLAPYA
ncbi:MULTISPECIES: FAD-dependent oxidoreductase [unclassified Nocardioides]|uniref:FAD-dependent oxidoreductase n=1 Tax=unclassified Nocardioides TaxID=2615069 RepID=UPI0006F8DCEA|nr:MULTISPECIES: hypothetical protein [unclassified Nocardioides]KQY51668.1 hypothetical protein ASD30_20090 [Nocardioides sp. Root140]KRF10930.1 hypothetical protein ASH02_19000 [Nocardioides sp. Soil796]